MTPRTYYTVMLRQGGWCVYAITTGTDGTEAGDKIAEYDNPKEAYEHVRRLLHGSASPSPRKEEAV